MNPLGFFGYGVLLSPLLAPFAAMAGATVLTYRGHIPPLAAVLIALATTLLCLSSLSLALLGLGASDAVPAMLGMLLTVPATLSFAGCLGFVAGFLLAHRRRLALIVAAPMLAGSALATGAYLFASLTAPAITEPGPTDTELAAHFYAHRGAMEELAVLAIQEEGLRSVGQTSWWSEGPATGFGAPQEPLDSLLYGPVAMRYQGYQKLLRAAELPSGMDKCSDTQLQFSYWSAGSLLGGVSKGFAYSVRQPDGIQDHLDSADATGYRHIEGHWYLYRQRIDGTRYSALNAPPGVSVMGGRSC